MDETFTRWLMGDTFGVEDTSPDLPAWMAQADPADWFPGKGHGYTAAAAVCDACPVRRDCLDHALALEGDDGPPTGPACGAHTEGAGRAGPAGRMKPGAHGPLGRTRVPASCHNE